jgi:hypothetical protein
VVDDPRPPRDEQPTQNQPTQAGEPVPGPDRGAGPHATPPAQDPWFGHDTTAFHPPVTGDETTALPPVDPSHTAPMPPVTGVDGEQGRWAARAEVRPPGPREAEQREWVPAEPRGTWWMPIAIGILALILLGLLGLGLWLALRGNAPAPLPSNSPTLAPTSAAPSPSSTPSPTVSPTPSPATVAIPNFLVGLSPQDAKNQLTALGLVPDETDRVDVARAGTVIDTQPAPGTVVPVGSTVTLIVAVAPASPSPSMSPPLSPSSTPNR